MESTVGPYKAEVIDHERISWSSWRQVEAATAEWILWYNDRLHSSVKDLPPKAVESKSTTIKTAGSANPLRPNPTLHHSQADSVTIPQDPGMVDGMFHYDVLRKRTQPAWLRAAAIARGL